MKTFVTLMILLTSSISFAFAQDEPEAFMKSTTPEQRAQFQTEYMRENLALTPEQESKIQDVNLKYAKKIQDAYNQQGRKVQKMKKLKAISDEKDKELKSILNPDQYATYQKNKEAMKEKIREKAKEKQGES